MKSIVHNSTFAKLFLGVKTLLIALLTQPHLRKDKRSGFTTHFAKLIYQSALLGCLCVLLQASSRVAFGSKLLIPSQNDKQLISIDLDRRPLKTILDVVFTQIHGKYIVKEAFLEPMLKQVRSIHVKKVSYRVVLRYLLEDVRCNLNWEFRGNVCYLSARAITVHIKDKAVYTILRDILSQAGVDYVCIGQDTLNRKVSVSIEEATLEQAILAVARAIHPEETLSQRWIGSVFVINIHEPVRDVERLRIYARWTHTPSEIAIQTFFAGAGENYILNTPVYPGEVTMDLYNEDFQKALIEMLTAMNQHLTFRSGEGVWVVMQEFSHFDEPE